MKKKVGNDATGSSVRDCVCNPGYYRLVEGSPCISCERDMWCGDPILFIETGFWRGRDTRCWYDMNGTSQDDKTLHCDDGQGKLPDEGQLKGMGEVQRATIHGCPKSSTCNPNKDSNDPSLDWESNRCAEGHTGVVCAMCQSGWVMKKRLVQKMSQ